MKLLIIGSSTGTIRAQELLLKSGVSSQIKRLDNTVDGCVRALRVEDGQVSRAVMLLAKNGIAVRSVMEA